MTTHSSILAWEILWIEEPDRSQSTEAKRVVHNLATKSCPALCDPLPCSSVLGISQARILEWVHVSFSKGSSQPRDRTHVSCIAGGFFTTEPPGKSTNSGNNKVKSETPSFLKIFYFFKFILIGG